MIQPLKSNIWCWVPSREATDDIFIVYADLDWPRDVVVLLDRSVLVFVSLVSPEIHLPSQAAFGQSAAAATELIRVEDEGGLTCVWKDMSQWLHDSVMEHNSMVSSSPCLLSVSLVVWTVIHSSIFYARARQGSTFDKLPVHRSVTEKDEQTFTLKLLPFFFFQFTSHALWEEASYSYFGGQSSFMPKALIKFSTDILWFPSKQLTAV